MGLFSSKKKKVRPTISRDQALSGRVVRNSSIEAERNDEGVLLKYPAAINPWFARTAKRFGVWDGKPVLRKLQLDEVGSRTWDWIDGERTVRQLVELLAKEYQLHPREAEVSMTAYLRELGRRGIIALL